MHRKYVLNHVNGSAKRWHFEENSLARGISSWLMLDWIHISRSSSPSIRFEEMMVVVPLDFSKGHKLEG
jgi:hypothetical protein